MACGVACGLTLGISLLLPKQYTSTASIFIDPPGGVDPRISTAVSPVYLESLKAFESFAASDTLFLRALDQFHLRSSAEATETLKRRILKVSKLRDTKLLQISVTLPDAKQAQAMAQFVAEETVKLSLSVSRDAWQQTLDQEQRAADEAKARFDKALVRQAPDTSTLELELSSLVDLRYQLRRDEIEARAAAADYAARESERDFAKDQATRHRQRADSLEKSGAALDQEIAAKAASLAGRKALREQIENETKAAQKNYEDSLTRLRDARAGAITNGERLKIIDPGIVPERPSSPNLLLNTVVSGAAALLGALVFLSLRFTLRR